MFPPPSPSTAAVTLRTTLVTFDCFLVWCLTGVPERLIEVSSESSELLLTPFFGSDLEVLELISQRAGMQGWPVSTLHYPSLFLHRTLWHHKRCQSCLSIHKTTQQQVVVTRHFPLLCPILLLLVDACLSELSVHCNV